MINPLLQLKQITCQRNNRRICDNFSINLHAQQLLQIVGNNGSGKTTLLQIAAGLLIPQSGHVYWQGQPIQQNLPFFYQHIFYLGHRNGIKRHLTVKENLIYDWRYPKPSAQQLHQSMDWFNLLSIQDQFCQNLSAGQQKRVALAKLLLSSTTLWILDEPYAAIDTTGIERLNDLIQVHLNQGGCVLLSSHLPLTMKSIFVRILRFPLRCTIGINHDV